MIQRLLAPRLRALVKEFKAVALLGPRQSGKTTLTRLLILEKIYRAPGLFHILRGVIDRRRRQGRLSRQFLFLGPASIDQLKQ